MSDLRRSKKVDPFGPSLMCPECRQIYLVPQVGETWRWTTLDCEGVITRSPTPTLCGWIDIMTMEGRITRNIDWKDIHRCPEWVFVKKA